MDKGVIQSKASLAFPLRSAFRRTRLYQVHLSPRTTCRAVDLTYYLEGRPMTTQSPSFNRQFVHGLSWTVTSHRTLRARQGRQAFEARLRRTRAGDWRDLGLISLPGLESESGLPESIAASAVGSIQSNLSPSPTISSSSGHRFPAKIASGAL